MCAKSISSNTSQKPYTHTHTHTHIYISQERNNTYIICLLLLSYIFMYTNLKPFSVMGLPSKIASAEKEAHATTTKRDFQSKQEALSEAGKSVAPAPPPPLKISLPSRGGEEEDGGCTTPKAAGRGESDLPKCPPPPRKPKSLPSTKRKAQRVLLDLSNEIDSLFPSNILRDFMCGKIKKVRTGCPQIL